MVRRRVRQDLAADDLQRLFEFRSEDWPGRCEGERFRAFRNKSEREIERESTLHRGIALEMIRAKLLARRAFAGHQCDLCRKSWL